ncbi:MAG: SoxR reducing system RseC family protein [Deltaproteobacteria bacterium]|nr:SoxR reducing system RseC family protein [Deltaproteobacteria bacterium]MBW2019626.1 SoxR reducing system RseC family protein [Deltaproteobacteria bacterium]MBW2074441.1 SoxR reducing system RseC family protein [Deltaproteobacteria bacterium]RLB82380.1 MAG: hypothetical protein DRH17_06120 [Deltaproteobacteria bacterium]
MGEKLTKTGVVKAVQGHMALVVTRMEPECESCKARDACSVMGGGGANIEVWVRNTARAQPGDAVTISIKGASLLKVSFLVYMVPILALIGGIILGHVLSMLIPVDKNVLVGLFCLLALFGTFLWLKKKSNKLANKQEFIPEIISKTIHRDPIPPIDFSCPGK